MLDVLNPVRARVAPTIWQRPTVAVWNAGADLRTEADWLAFHLPRFGFEVVCVKVLDGAHRFTGSHGHNLSADWLRPLRKAGLRITGWGYCYGYDPGAEVLLALELSHELGLEAFVADCEAEFSYDPVDAPQAGEGRRRYARSGVWTRTWASAKRRPPLGLSSFGRVDLHRLDWAAWTRIGARFLPQAYANESVELTPFECVRAARPYWDHRFVHPWVGVYQGAAGRPSPESYLQSLRLARVRGFGVYLADTATVGELAAFGHGK